MANQQFPQFGDLTVETFLRDYWQKRPVLIRQAFPNYQSPITPDELAGLACEEVIESRIILEEHQGQPWVLQNGPFDAKHFNSLPETHWSLLVQAVDQWIPEIGSLKEAFRFIPDWRIDDIMISYAPEGGSVGPHYDQYDVFLLQAEGQRHWQTGPRCNENTPVRDDTPLSILQQFCPEEDWVLEPGDMLYLPPGYAHWGRALGECMTFSIGFRAPSQAEILAYYVGDICSQLAEDQRYSDPDLTLQDNPGQIPVTTVEQLIDTLKMQLLDQHRMAEWFGRHMTEPKYPELDVAFCEDELPSTHGDILNHAPYYKNPSSRFAYFETAQQCTLFVDGQSYVSPCPLASDFFKLLCKNVHYSQQDLNSFVSNEQCMTLFIGLLQAGAIYCD